MNKIVKIADAASLGEDPHASLSLARHTGNEALTRQATEEVQRQYRLRIRVELEQNTDVISVVTNSNPAISAAPQIIQKLQFLCREESSDIFTGIVHELLTELDELRKKPGSMYLVDTDTGKAGMAISAQHIYRPPGFINDFGKIVKSQPILHPGLSAPIIQDRHEKARLNEAITKAPPSSSLALEHLRDPEKIRSRVLEELITMGITIREIPDPNSNKIILDFGREQVDGALQALNPRFHRSNLFSLVLKQKILQELGSNKSCFLGDIQTMSNSKRRWYEIELQTP